MECDMKKINIKAYAKINLSLDVLGLKDDGFHNVSMVMQQIELHDEVLVRFITRSELEAAAGIRSADHLSKRMKATEYILICTVKRR